MSCVVILRRVIAQGNRAAAMANAAVEGHFSRMLRRNHTGAIRLSILALALLAVRLETASAQASRWYRGNTHTHSLESDGDSPPDSLARWYRDAGYGFLFITDHEKLTDPAPLNAAFARPGSFLLIAGQEVTQRIVDSSRKEPTRQAHVNALGLTRVVMPLGDKGLASGVTMRDVYARNLTAIRDAGGIAQVNHPNWRWSVRLNDLLAVPDSTLLEIANGHAGVNNAGGHDDDGGLAPSTEALWDSLLTRGKLLFAVADDDAHHFKAAGSDVYTLTRPGRGWIMVRADTLTAGAILSAIRRGDFYASTGVTLADVVVGPATMRLAIPRTGFDDRRYITEFVGSGGRVLARVHGLSPAYSIRGDEGYVRARVTDSNGRMAWTQPVMLRAR